MLLRSAFFLVALAPLPALAIPIPGPPKAKKVESAAPSSPLDAAAAPALAPAPAVAPNPGPRLQATLMTHVAAGKQPTTCTIVDGGRGLLVTNRGDNTVSVFSTEDMSLTKTIAEVGYSAWGVAQREDGQILVANWAGSSIALIDGATGKRTGEVPVGMKPSYVALSRDGKRVYSAGNFSEDVTIADITGKRNLRTLPIGRRPMGVAVSADGRFLYVAVCDSKKISKVDLVDEVVAQTFGAPLASTTNLVITPDGRKLLAAGEGGRLLVVDTETGDVEKVAAGNDLSSVAVTPDGRVALVADYADGSVSLIDLPAREKYATVPVGAGAIHVETDGHRFYTCNDKAGSVSAYRLEPEDGAARSGH